MGASGHVAPGRGDSEGEAPPALAEDEEPDDGECGERGERGERVPRREPAAAHAAARPQAAYRPFTEVAPGSSHTGSV